MMMMMMIIIIIISAQASNYHPIACLPMMWKLLTGVMGEKLYHHLERNGLLRDEQKG